MIDFWNIKSDNTKKVEEQPISDDPLDKISADFSGIVELKDDDKGEIDPVADIAEQQEIFQHETEEFLSEDEIGLDDED